MDVFAPAADDEQRGDLLADDQAEVHDPVTLYAERVCRGLIVAGPHVRDACARHLRDFEHGAARGLRFDDEMARYYIAFYEHFLCLNGGDHEGKPFVLQLWQKFIVGSLFGWMRMQAGEWRRRYKVAYIEIGKGNGKSPLAAGIGLAGLLIDQEPRAEIYAAATKKDQAMIMFRDAVAMVDLSPMLTGRIRKSGVGEKVWNLFYEPTASFYKPISSDDGQSGPRPHISLVDEVHEHKTALVLDMLRAGQKGRRQPLMVMITNSGSDRNSPCWQQHEASVRCNNAQPGEPGFDDTLFNYVCALDKGDDWRHDPRCWIKANPNLGVSIPVSYLEEAVTTVRNMPSKANVIARLNFCCWTDADEAWIGAEPWMAAELMQPDRESLRGASCYIGIDLSKRRDLTAAAYFFPDANGGGDAFVEFWTPADTLSERAEVDQVPYAQWVTEGHLHALPGKSVEYDRVVRDIGNTIDALDLHVVAAPFDRWRIEEFKRAVDSSGLDLPLVEYGQGFKDMSPAVERLENMLVNGTIRVHYNPVLRWNVACAATEEDAAGNRKFSKRKATGRIDGIVALAMAVGAAAKAEPETGTIEQGFIEL